MQEIPTWLKTGILKSTAFGTALSITLQLTCCYAGAFASTEDAAPSTGESQPGTSGKLFSAWQHKRHSKKSSQNSEADASLIPEKVLLANGQKEEPTSIALGGLEAVPPANLTEDSKSGQLPVQTSKPSESGLEAMAPVPAVGAPTTPEASAARAQVPAPSPSAATSPEAIDPVASATTASDASVSATGQSAPPDTSVSASTASSSQPTVPPVSQLGATEQAKTPPEEKVAMAATSEPANAPPAVTDENIKLAAATTTTTTTTTTSPLLTGVSMTDTGDPVEKITRDVIVKIFELERLNTYFWAESTKQSKWRPWRMLISEETAAIGVAAGTLIAIEQSLRSLHTGYKFHTVQIGPQLVFAKIFRPPGKVVLEHAFVTALPGIWFAVWQECFELGQNYFTDWQTKQKGFDAKTTRAKAKELQDQIDSLLHQRESAVAASGLSPQALEIETAEAKVLHDLRDMAVQEYADDYVAVRKIRCNQNCFYFWDIAEKITGVLSLQAGLQATRHGKLKNLEAFGVLQIVSAGILELTPVVSRFYAGYRGQKSREHVAQYVHGNPATTPEVFEADRKHLQDVYLANGGSRSQALLNNLQARDAVYKSENETFYALKALTNRDKQEEARAFKHAMLVRTFAAACKIAYGTQSGIVLGDGRQTAPRKVTELILGGTIPYEVALDANIYDKFSEAIRTKKLENQLKGKGELRGQVYRSRLDRMDQAQHIITPGH
jgi:hypothetical protein